MNTFKHIHICQGSLLPLLKASVVTLIGTVWVLMGLRKLPSISGCVISYSLMNVAGTVQVSDTTCKENPISGQCVDELSWIPPSLIVIRIDHSDPSGIQTNYKKQTQI